MIIELTQVLVLIIQMGITPCYGSQLRTIEKQVTCRYKLSKSLQIYKALTIS